MIEELIISIKKSKFRFFLMAVLFTIVFFLQNFILFESENVQAASKSLQTVYDGKDYFYIGKNFAVITALKGFDLIEDRNTMFTRGLYA